MNHNEQTVRALYQDVLSQGRLELLDTLFANAAAAARIGASVRELRGGFPDIHYVLEDIVADGDRVAVRWHWTGTHEGTFRNIAPTSRAIRDSGMAIYTLHEGKITDVTLETDRLGFLQQIGAVIDTRSNPGAVYLIDTFIVPAAARAELEAAMRRNREYIRSLEGFRGDAVFVRDRGEGSFDIATLAAWESPAAIASARQKVAAFYERIGFDMPAAIARWGVTMQRAICSAPMALQ
jgi:predicted ester cyclase